MFTRCLVCSTPFSPNETLEHFPLGSRIAFDPNRGRLWSICRHCKRWSLTPMEERWEALEELEKLVKDKARLLAQTDNIALLRAENLQIVRVGQANLTEEAWWRYGRELTQRREQHQKVTTVATVGAAAAIFGGMAAGGLGLFGAWIFWDKGPRKITDAARWFRFGSTAWRGDDSCLKCGHRFRNVAYRDRGGLYLLPAGHDHDQYSTLSYRCPSCGDYREGGLQLRGQEAEHTLRRVLAFHHHAGATQQVVGSATRLLEEAGSANDLIRIMAKNGRRLGDLKSTGAIALEIAANEKSEQRLLELELADLEDHWRREEELASIVDGELTPLPLLEDLRRKVISTLS